MEGSHISKLFKKHVMNKLFFFSLSLFFHLDLTAQLSFSVQQPPSGVVQSNQLWNVTLINSGNPQMTVMIAIRLFDPKNDQLLMTAYSRPIVLNSGVRQLNSSDVAPIDYNYVSPAFNVGRLGGSLLPVGEYRACYTIFPGNKNSEVSLAEDCIDLEIDPLSPPQLNLPADSGVVETPYPQFSWLPPTPILLFNNLNYDILVAEVQQGQSPYEAIQENLPVYFGHHLTFNSLNYPASYKALDTGKIYAWRIVAKNEETFSAQSEVWTFKVASKKQEPVTPANGIYFELENENSFRSSGNIPNDILGIKYYSYDQTHDANVQFLDEKGQVIKEVTRTIQYGNNFLVFKLDNHFVEDKLYSVEITDMQSSHFKTSFRMQSNKTKN
jgi:hypothetical protein